MNKDFDLGKWVLPTRWDEVTLGQFAELEKLYKGEASKGVDAVDLISIMSGRTKDEVMALPVDFMETMTIHLVFLEIQPEIEKPIDRVEIDGETYIINVKEKLKFGEYVDFDQLVKNDPCDYPSMLAILCRKEGEAYDSDFIANEFQKRVEMFASQPVTKILPLIAFFLEWSTTYMGLSSNYSMTKEALSQEVQNLENSAKLMGGKGLRMYLLMKKFKKLKKLINRI